MFKAKWISLNSLCLLLLSFFLYSFQAFSKTIVISDIDDTLKKSNSAGKGPEQIYHFLKKVPYLEMRDLFNEIKENEKSRGESIKFYYVSAAKTYTFNAQKWLQKYNFPLGRSTLKDFGEHRETYDFKYAVIKKIILDEMQTVDLTDLEPFEVLMFGDNAQVDAQVYSVISKELNLNAKIYIRDVRSTSTFFDSTLPVDQLEGVTYYFSEVELFKKAEFNFLSHGLLARTYDSYQKRTLIPAYTLKTFNRRLSSVYGDKEQGARMALMFWNDYYSRF